ncbi:MAG TPA: hypothetical protein VK463_10960 [Desulfomonilaceae bacterium]|nr:hypothetical protein [Desulfomonilaceae bacterium]
MRRFLFVTMILLAWPVLGHPEHGMIASENEFKARLAECRLSVLRKSASQSQHHGVFIYCLCEKDKGKILYEYTVLETDTSDTSLDELVAAFRKRADKCGGCAREPGIEDCAQQQ